MTKNSNSIPIEQWENEVQKKYIKELEKNLNKATKVLKQVNQYFIWKLKGPYGPSPKPDQELLDLINSVLPKD